MSNSLNNECPSFFSVLTASVRYDNRLSASEKIFYSEISALTNSFGFCSASNNYFMKLYNCDKRTIQNWVKKLSDLHYIRIEKINNNTRKIYLDFSGQVPTYENKVNTNKKVIPSCVKDFFNKVK